MNFSCLVLWCTTRASASLKPTTALLASISSVSFTLSARASCNSITTEFRMMGVERLHGPVYVDLDRAIDHARLDRSRRSRRRAWRAGSRSGRTRGAVPSGTGQDGAVGTREPGGSRRDRRDVRGAGDAGRWNRRWAKAGSSCRRRRRRTAEAPNPSRDAMSSSSVNAILARNRDVVTPSPAIAERTADVVSHVRGVRPPTESCGHTRSG